MPELPEVEVVKKSLENQILNLTIKDVKLNDINLRYKVKKQEINKIIGLKILRIERRSKYLLFFFNNNSVMIAHLGMTGKFFILKKKEVKIQKTSFYYEITDAQNEKHNRFILIFKNDLKLIYNDVRKFGFIKFELKDKIYENQHLKVLGPEPLSKSFNFEYFRKYLLGKSKMIKDLLMDQKFISGLGNIYVNEILYLSEVRPTKKTARLTNKEINNIIQFTKEILLRAIKLGGSSIKDFSSTSGKKGLFQQYFSVYGKKGENCPKKNCKGTITKIVLANRASFYCSKCQK